MGGAHTTPCQQKRRKLFLFEQPWLTQRKIIILNFRIVLKVSFMTKREGKEGEMFKIQSNTIDIFSWKASRTKIYLPCVPLKSNSNQVLMKSMEDFFCGSVSRVENILFQFQNISLHTILWYYNNVIHILYIKGKHQENQWKVLFACFRR